MANTPRSVNAQWIDDSDWIPRFSNITSAGQQEDFRPLCLERLYPLWL
jgi:hypothetical protein